MLRLALPVVAAAAALAAGGCGGSGDEAPANAQPYSARSPLPGTTKPVSAAVLQRPIGAYRAHVRRELAGMLVAVGSLRAAIARGDRAGARAAWLRAQARYEAIGAAYGAFGELDRAINGTPAGLPGGERSKRFTGLHRIELALWDRRSTADARIPAARLQRDVARLRSEVGRMEIEPLDFGLRAHEVLEDTLHLQLSGQASPWSGSALTALNSNIEGTRVVLRGLSPILRQRNALVLEQSEEALDRLERAVRGVRRQGRPPRWDALGQRRRERIAGLTAKAAEELAYVPEYVDPRPPRPLQRAVETR